MDEYINKQQAINAICMNWCNCRNADCLESFWCVGCGDVETLQKLPSVDAVEVVLCKDCKYNDGKGSIADGRYWCNRHQAFMSYCSDADRRDDG